MNKRITQEEKIKLAWKIVNICPTPQLLATIVETTGSPFHVVANLVRLMKTANLLRNVQRKGFIAFGNYTREQVAEKLKNKERSEWAKPEVEMSKRKCRKCEGNLPTSRYYECLKCRPQLDEDMGDFLYLTGSTSDDLSDLEMPSDEDFAECDKETENEDLVKNLSDEPKAQV